MGSNSSSGGGGGNRDTSANNVPPSRRKYQPVTGTLSDPREKDDTAAKMDLFINNPYTKKQGGPLVLRPLEPLFDAGAKKTRTFFSDKVLNSKRAKQNIGYTKEEFSKLSRTKQEEVYKGYMSKRQSGSTDAYGNKLNKNSGPDNQVVQAPLVETTMPGVTLPPTTSEVSQSAATDAAEDSLILRKRKTKARGRSPTIMTGVTGATGSLTLGKPSLLGR